MTNKQAYAGLLERLRDGEPIGDDFMDAAEAISSLLKALTAARAYVDEKADDAYSTREDDLLAVIDAALNSDAPLSTGDGL